MTLAATLVPENRAPRREEKSRIATRRKAWVQLRVRNLLRAISSALLPLPSHEQVKDAHAFPL
jgi:hypothetical protein